MKSLITPGKNKVYKPNQIKPEIVLTMELAALVSFTALFFSQFFEISSRFRYGAAEETDFNTASRLNKIELKTN